MRSSLPLQLATIAQGNMHQFSFESGTPGTVAELSETECDMDTMKQFKLGMRSSLWSRPTAGNTNIDSDRFDGDKGQQRQPETNSHPSDYSIAV